MHELSIALNILEIAEEEAERRGLTGVIAIHLKLGPLSGVVPQALQSAYGLAREGSALRGAGLVIEEVPLIVYCPACDAERSAISVQQLCCAQCGTVTPHIVSGHELDIAALEIQA